MSATAMNTRDGYYVCFSPMCYGLTCCNQWMACSACHPKNDFWSCPAPLYGLLQLISCPLRATLASGCCLTATLFMDAPRWVGWLVCGCGLCCDSPKRWVGCDPEVADVPGSCHYYLAPNLATHKLSSRGHREIRGCREFCRALCCVVAQDKFEESVCFECCERNLPRSNLSYCWNPANTQSEQVARADFEDRKAEAAQHRRDVAMMTREDGSV